MFEFDPFDPAYFADPFSYYAVMRDEHPVYEREIENHRIWPRYWMLSRAGDVNASLKDWRTFSSAKGTLIDTDSSLIPPNIFNMDPPRHDELRAVLSGVLTPKRVADLEPEIVKYTRELVEEFGPTGEFDVATDLAQVIPTVTMCSLMGLPISERGKFLEWNLVTMTGADFTSPAALAAYAEMGEYWVDVVADRRNNRGSDLISQILHTEVNGDPLSDDEVAGFCSLIHDAAQNTTMNMISHSVMALGRHADERRRLVSDPELLGNAVEELFRFVSPVQGLARTTTRDVTLHDVTIPEGEQVLMLYGSANHDPEVYPDPERLDLGREVRTSWAFGHGLHYCLGNAVARLETRVAIKSLVEQIGDWGVAEDRVVLDQLVPTRGVAHGPITF
jgi:cytochrome P450